MLMKTINYCGICDVGRKIRSVCYCYQKVLVMIYRVGGNGRMLLRIGGLLA